MGVAGRVGLIWRDPDAHWDPAAHANLTSIPVKEADIWTPPLRLHSAGARVPIAFESEAVTVNWDGTCELLRSVTLRIYIGAYRRRARFATELHFALKGRENHSVRLKFLPPHLHPPFSPGSGHCEGTSARTRGTTRTSSWRSSPRDASGASARSGAWRRPAPPSTAPPRPASPSPSSSPAR